VLAQAADEQVRKILTHATAMSQHVLQGRGDVGRAGVKGEFPGKIFSGGAEPFQNWNRLVLRREFTRRRHEWRVRRRLKKMIQRKAAAIRDRLVGGFAGGADLRLGSGWQHRRSRAYDCAAADNFEAAVCRPHREYVQRVAEGIGADSEVFAARGDLERKIFDLLGHLAARLQVNRLPSGGGRSTVLVAREMSDRVPRHGQATSPAVSAWLK
jgi:hypothetical protein